MSEPDRMSGLRWAVLIEGGLAILALIAAWIFRVPLRELFPAPALEAARAAFVGVVATLPMLAVFWWLMHVRRHGLQRLREQVQQLVDELFHRASIVELAFVSALAGVGEELLFRGVLQSLVERWTTPLVGLIVASLVFGMLHAVSRLYFVFATLTGVYLGWLMLHFHNLVAPIVAHGLYDFAALMYLSRCGKRVATVVEQESNDA